MKQLRIGLIGYGFMGRTHSNAFRKVNHFFDLEYQPVLKAVCARDAANARAFAAKWGYESIETDWRKLVERDDIDLIDIAAPNNVHAEIAIAAAKAGKMIPCKNFALAVTGRFLHTRGQQFYPYETTPHRTHRLRLHGPDSFQRFQPG